MLPLQLQPVSVGACKLLRTSSRPAVPQAATLALHWWYQTQPVGLASMHSQQQQLQQQQQQQCLRHLHLGERIVPNVDQAGSSKALKLLFGNITCLGPQVWDWLNLQADLHSKWHALAFVEHHLDNSGLHTARGRLARLGYRCTASIAKATGRSEAGTSGGAMVCPCNTLKVTALPETGPPGVWPLGRGNDWAASIVHLKGCSILLLVTYFTCSIGPSGANLEKMYEISMIIRRLALPYIVIGDFNATPQQLAASHWLEDIKAVVVTPGDVSYTCTSGKQRMLDYAIVHEDLQHAVKIQVNWNVPWKTHFGLEVAILAAPRALLHRIHRRALPIPPPVPGVAVTWDQARVAVASWKNKTKNS